MQYGKEKNAHKIFSAIQTFFLGFLGFIGILLTIIVPLIVDIEILGYRLIGPNFLDGLDILPVILISYYFFALYVLLLPKIYISEKTFIIPIIRGIGAFSNITLNFILIPFYGIMGAAFATLGAFIIMFVSIFVATNKIEHSDYNYLGWIFPLAMWCFILFFDNYIVFVFVALIYPIAWYNMILNVYEKHKIKKIFI